MDRVDQPGSNIDDEKSVHSRPLWLLSSLYHSLSHQIRTPLSVISNELACIDSGVGEVSRSQRRCREIVDILDSIPAAALTNPNFENINFADLGIAALTSQSVLLRADRKLLSLAFHLFEALCADLFQAKPAFASMIRTTSDSKATALVLKVTINNGRFRPIQRRYQSLTDYFCTTLEIDSPIPPFIDAILWAHDVNIEIIASNSSAFSFILPVIDL
jgi:hypothetical protein